MVKSDSRIGNRTKEEHAEGRSLGKDEDELLNNYLELEVFGPPPGRMNRLKLVLLLVIFLAVAGLLGVFI